MNVEIKGITLDYRFFALPELIQFCADEINAGVEPEWKLNIYRFILDFLNDSDFIFQLTSGTTGTAKNIKLPKNSMLVSAQNTIDFFGLKKNDTAVLCLPIQYIAGKMMAVRALLAEMNLILTEPSGTPDLSEIGEIDFCAMVPMQALNLLNKDQWVPIKKLILGGAETSPELVLQLQKVITEVYETYGMAETCSHIALKRINGNQPEDSFIIMPGVRISTSENDCLIIDADYLRKKIITGDRVELISQNKFKWLGRADNVINSGGIKIQPEILEKQIQEILQMSCAICSESDSLLGNKIVLVIESEKKLEFEPILEKLIPHFDRKLLPKSIRFIKEIPRNQSFKIDRIRLKRLI